MATAEKELEELVEEEFEEEYEEAEGEADEYEEAEGEAEEYEGEYEVEVIEPMSKTAAKALHKKVQSATTKILTQREVLFDLLEEAAAGQIHVALGYASWPAWLADAVNYTPLDLTERQELVRAFSAKGASQRAIAGMFNISQSTAGRDLEGVEFEDNTVTSLSGKTVARKKNTAVEEEAEPEPPTRKRPLADDFHDEVVQLQMDMQEVREIRGDSRYGKSRKRIAKENLNELQAIRTELDEIIDELTAV